MRYIKSTVVVYWISEYCKREFNNGQCSMLYIEAVHCMCYVTLNKDVMLIHEWLHSKMTMHDDNYKCVGATSIVTSYSRSTTEMTSCVCSCTQHIKYMSVQKQCHVYAKCLSNVVALLSRLHISVGHQESIVITSKS